MSALREETATLFLNSLNKAEGMANGVEEDPKSRARLKLGLRRAELQREGLTLVEIVHEKIEMKALGLGTFGPRRRNDVRDFLKPDGGVTTVH